ncbi:DUF1330 domain-containing protein [Acidimicrobiales bacterium]|jgi:uncharacterized protein (DUF1330 family)|nr:DUF1330 domain-containing protein [bacterium]MDB4206036.1 DUF1330 domain-containing protein [bacterium]MDB4818147.1 DUF1330 domain-containing protein [Acidimicrobiales bacterium]MDC1389388.1 DUF1330 domain-containing protein [Acidimicrobiales bacterium]MDG1088563.1 DUF1330 domain-containing protein [Acidimicrobiales bacterium]
MGYVHADYDVIAKMAESDLDEPVVMLNLLKYRDQAESGHGVDGLTGRQAYTKYGQAFAELEPRFGGSVMWMGRGKHTVIGGDEEWDIIILVTYPTRRQFIEMFNDPDYQAIAPIRAAALADSRIVESTQLVPKL